MSLINDVLGEARHGRLGELHVAHAHAAEHALGELVGGLRTCNAHAIHMRGCTCCACTHAAEHALDLVISLPLPVIRMS